MAVRGVLVVLALSLACSVVGATNNGERGGESVPERNPRSDTTRVQELIQKHFTSPESVMNRIHQGLSQTLTPDVCWALAATSHHLSTPALYRIDLVVGQYVYRHVNALNQVPNPFSKWERASLESLIVCYYDHCDGDASVFHRRFPHLYLPSFHDLCRSACGSFMVNSVAERMPATSQSAHGMRDNLAQCSALVQGDAVVGGTSAANAIPSSVETIRTASNVIPSSVGTIRPVTNLIPSSVGMIRTAANAIPSSVEIIRTASDRDDESEFDAVEAAVDPEDHGLGDRELAPKEDFGFGWTAREKEVRYLINLHFGSWDQVLDNVQQWRTSPSEKDRSRAARVSSEKINYMEDVIEVIVAFYVLHFEKWPLRKKDGQKSDLCISLECYIYCFYKHHDGDLASINRRRYENSLYVALSNFRKVCHSMTDQCGQRRPKRKRHVLIQSEYERLEPSNGEDNRQTESPRLG